MGEWVYSLHNSQARSKLLTVKHHLTSMGDHQALTYYTKELLSNLSPSSRPRNNNNTYTCVIGNTTSAIRLKVAVLKSPLAPGANNIDCSTLHANSKMKISAMPRKQRKVLQLPTYMSSRNLSIGQCHTRHVQMPTTSHIKVPAILPTFNRGSANPNNGQSLFICNNNFIHKVAAPRQLIEAFTWNGTIRQRRQHAPMLCWSLAFSLL